MLGPGAQGYADLVHEAGGQPLVCELLQAGPKGGVALRREWVADQAEIFCSAARPGALLVGPCGAENLTGLTLAALRLALPIVVVPGGSAPFDVVPHALGLAPLGGEPVEVVVEAARSRGPRAGGLVDNFSLANTLRAGLSAGVGPQLLVHLASVAREAGVAGFSQMIRVLAPENPAVANPGWLRQHGPAGLLAALGDVLHDTSTVTGRLKENLPPQPRLPNASGRRLFFSRGKASGTEVVCQADPSAEEVSGQCRVFASEEEAVRAVEGDEVGEGELLVVAGRGARGGPGLLVLNELGAALAKAGLDVPVLTDGLPPSEAFGSSAWLSLFSPEAASGGVIGLLKDGDTLRFDLIEGRIRTGISAEDLSSRGPYAAPNLPRFGYAARYARSALPGVAGAGFA